MKHLSAILALAILLTAGLACSDGGENNPAPSSAGNSTTAKTNDAKNNDTKDDDAKDDSTDEVKIEWIKLYNDNGSGDEGNEVTSFKPTDNPQHFVARMSEFEGGMKIRFVLIAVDAGGEKNFKIMEKEQETNSFTNQIVLTAKLPRPFPVGDYRADCYVNGKLSKSVNYKVQ